MTYMFHKFTCNLMLSNYHLISNNKLTTPSFSNNGRHITYGLTNTRLGLTVLQRATCDEPSFAIAYCVCIMALMVRGWLGFSGCRPVASGVRTVRTNALFALVPFFVWHFLWHNPHLQCFGMSVSVSTKHTAPAPACLASKISIDSLPGC